MRTDEEKVLYGAYRLRQRIIDKIQQMKENTNGLQGVSYDRPRVQASRADSSVEKQAEKNLKLYEEITELQKQIDDVIQIIKKIPDTTESMLLENYTYEGSWKKCMLGSPREFRQTRLSALEHFGEILRLKGGEQVEENDRKTGNGNQ